MSFLYGWMLRLFDWRVPVVGNQDASQFYGRFNSFGLSVAAGLLLLVAIVCVLLYYFWWSNGSSKAFMYRYRIKWWFMWMMISSLVASVVTPLVLKWVIFRSVPYNFNKALLAVSVCNFLYAIPLFVLLSLVVVHIAHKQTNASCTPFVISKIRK